MAPFIPLTHDILISTYFLMISLGALAGIIWFLNRTPAADETHALNISIVSLIAAFLGARLFHIIYEEPGYYYEHPLAIFQVWRGGFVFYGGMIAGLGTTIFLLRRNNLIVNVWLDRVSLPIGLSYAIGRIGCFLNGCCYGKICNLPWAVMFPSHAAEGMAVISRHPTQLYATLWESVVVFGLSKLEKKKFFRKPGELFWTWLSLHAIGRLIMEYFRDDDRGRLIFGWSVSSLIAVALLASALGVLYRSKTCKITP
jgi:phosphatidylglycerol---prolipoprotein diacylglyceryl transferase